MALWTDIIDPATLTGYARESLNAYEAQRGSLSAFLPNKLVTDTVARVMLGESGFIEEARWRAFDAEPEILRKGSARRVTMDLPAVSGKIPVTEYEQLAARRVSDDVIRNAIMATADRVVRATADAVERLRGTVLVTGRATIAQSNYAVDESFGRDASLNVTAPTLWSDPAADPAAYLETLMDLAVQTTGQAPGALVVSTPVLRLMAKNAAFATNLANGASRPATVDEMKATLAGYGIPEVFVYDRRTSAGRVIPEGTILLLPAPGSEDLGATLWGQTLTSTSSDYQLADVDMPGLVVGTYRNEQPPLIAEVIGDAIALPILGNANASIAARVL